MNVLDRVPCTLCRPALIVAGLMFVISGALAADPIPASPPSRIYVPAQVERIADQSVSPTMQMFIQDFVRASIRRDALEATEDTEVLGQAIQERHRTLVALAFQPPVNVMELAAKLAAITEYAEDTERWASRAAAQDAARLAQEAR